MKNKKVKAKQEQQMPEPALGLGATIWMWTDSHAAPVVNVLSPARVLIRRDEAKRLGPPGLREDQHYTFSIGTSEDLEVRKASNGVWYTKGGVKSGTRVTFGERHEFRDPSF